MLMVPVSGIPTWLGELGDAGQVLAGLAALVGLVVLAVQVRNLAEQTAQQSQAVRASVIQGITSQMLTIDQIFVDHPDLRQFFYGKNVPIARDHPHYNRSLAIAEMLVDLIDCVLSLEKHMPDDILGWQAYARELSEQSVPIRTFLGSYGHWYAPVTMRAMESPTRTAAPSTR